MVRCCTMILLVFHVVILCCCHGAKARGYLMARMQSQLPDTKNNLNVFERTMESDPDRTNNRIIAEGLPYVFSRTGENDVDNDGMNVRYPTPVYGLSAMRNVRPHLKAIGPKNRYATYPTDITNSYIATKDGNVLATPENKEQETESGDIRSSNILSEKKLSSFRKIRRRTSPSRMSLLRNIPQDQLTELLKTMETSPLSVIDTAPLMTSLGRDDLSINLDLDTLTNMLASVRRQKYVGKMTEARNLLRNIG